MHHTLPGAQCLVATTTSSQLGSNKLSLSVLQADGQKHPKKANLSTDSTTPQRTQINSETYWDAGEWAMSYDWLSESSIVAGTGWGRLYVTPRFSVNVSKSVEVPTKCRLICTQKKRLFKHIYMCSQVHAYSETHTLAVSVLPCVSSFACSHSLREEGPNFSLISFIKRCREERRKRRWGEGETGGKKVAGGQIGEWWIGHYTAECTTWSIKGGAWKCKTTLRSQMLEVQSCGVDTQLFFKSKTLCDWQNILLSLALCH